jgi:ATP phosphoribosyltransferase regulatory subunit
MARYGQSIPATGFAFNVLRLLQGLEKQSSGEAGKPMDLLIFNQLADRRDALAIATDLRRKGFSVVRDIIRRDFEESLAYARRMNIRQIMVIGGPDEADDEVCLVRVDSGERRAVKKNLLAKQAEELLR